MKMYFFRGYFPSTNVGAYVFVYKCDVTHHYICICLCCSEYCVSCSPLWGFCCFSQLFYPSILLENLHPAICHSSLRNEWLFFYLNVSFSWYSGHLMSFFSNKLPFELFFLPPLPAHGSKGNCRSISSSFLYSWLCVSLSLRTACLWSRSLFFISNVINLWAHSFFLNHALPHP